MLHVEAYDTGEEFVAGRFDLANAVDDRVVEEGGVALGCRFGIVGCRRVVRFERSINPVSAGCPFLHIILVADDDPIFLDLFGASLPRDLYDIVAVGESPSSIFKCRRSTGCG
jgi:hypothetical protein